MIHAGSERVPYGDAAGTVVRAVALTEFCEGGFAPKGTHLCRRRVLSVPARPDVGTVNNSLIIWPPMLTLRQRMPVSASHSGVRNSRPDLVLYY